MFDVIASERAQWDAAFGASVEWQRMDDRKMSKVCLIKSFDGFDREIWANMAEWMAANMKTMQKVFSQPVNALRPSGGGERQT